MGGVEIPDLRAHPACPTSGQIADIRVVKTDDFKGVSVTAERWLPLSEVPVQALPAWLAFKRAEGYVLVGLEQTTGSVQLTEFKWPRRCLLLLGAEGRGVPASLIPLLDFCVEIPQLGVIRSLNVAAATALTVFSYSQQHALAEATGGGS